MARLEPFHVDNGGIARFIGGAVLGAHHGVVLFVDPALGGDVGQAGQLQGDALKIFGAWHHVHVEVLVFGVVGGLAGFAVVDRRPAAQHEGLGRNFGQFFPVPEVAHVRTFSHNTDGLTVDVPFFENGFHIGFAAFVYHDQHALLRFRQKNLPRLHAVLTCRNFVQIDIHAYAATCRHFTRRTGNACGTHVLHAHDGTRLGELHRRFQKQLLLEGIAQPVRRGCRWR